ncbi:MAG TPA: trypsin-like peptidase domain-containing protein [Candidatus Acidoferrales bacterium]|nr:trypsin-like peptidase domain-containing protein [Candidatus Acidoferrales bacterium]
MGSAREKILIVQANPSSFESLLALLGSAGYEVLVASAKEALPAARKGPDLVLLDGQLPEPGFAPVLSELKGSAAISVLRIVLLSTGGSDERARALDLGADDVIALPWDPAELLARVRAQLRAKRTLDELREKTHIAEEGQEIAHTAFQALAVTEKMARDATSLDRKLKIGVAAVFLVAALMAGIFFLYSRRAEKETKRAYAVIARLERGTGTEQDLMARSRKRREELEQAATEQKQLEKQSEELRARIAGPGADDLAALRQQLGETSERLRRIEGENRVAQNIIRSYAPSVCLLHVAVAFRDKESGQRLRYAGINPRGEPLQDSEGNPIFTLTGRGPEVRADFFGTGFLVATDGRILTNHHLVEPWWKNEELDSITREGIEAVIAEINAYFPDSPHPFRVEIQQISADEDLALVQGDLSELKRPALLLDESTGAAIGGQPVVSVGYATGLDAILARAGEETAHAIVASTSGNPGRVLAELARRSLIRPTTTQGHIGDVLPDKIVYDAQTTSGGSGGPLFNQHGKVIGVTFAVVKGFGGSNFGIPIRFAMPLLAPSRAGLPRQN